MVEAITLHFKEQGKRMTNLNKISMSKLEKIVEKFDIDIEAFCIQRRKNMKEYAAAKRIARVKAEAEEKLEHNRKIEEKLEHDRHIEQCMMNIDKDLLIQKHLCMQRLKEIKFILTLKLKRLQDRFIIIKTQIWFNVRD